jgi:hypothetical protein
MPLSIAKYVTSGYPFPLDDIDPKEKDKDWGKKWCEAIYASWKQGGTAIPYNRIEEFQLLRDLAAGRQDVLQYQKILLDESDEKGAQTGYMNINWDIPSVMPKFLRVVEGMMEQTDHQVVATAVDPTSTDDKEAAKLDMQYRMKFKEALNYIDKAMGVDKSDEYIPESMEELNLYEGAGGFKLAREREIEEVLDYSFYISEWKETKKKIIRDLCVINCCATKDYTDKYTRKVKARYVDPAKFIGQYSRFQNHKNMEFGGELTQILISDIRKLNPDVPESTLRELADNYNGIRGNISLDTLTYNADIRSANYDSFLVDVMDAEWMSINSEYKTKRKTQYGFDIMYDEDWGKVVNTEKKKTEKYDIKVVYKCKWIIGTDYVYDFGLQFDVPRPGKKEVELSYHLYKLPYRSLVSLSETHIHQMVLAYFKLQNAIAMSAPKGLAIEFTSLQNMALGAKKLQPLDLIKIKTQTGTLLYKSTTHKGVPNVPGGFKPIQELEGGIGNQLVEFIKVWEFNAEDIRETTGINQAADASSPDPNAPVGSNKMAIAATNNALRPIYSAYLNIKEKTAKNLSLRIQLLIKHDKEAYEGYMPVLGSMGVQIVSAGADTVDADYYIKYEAKPTDERRDVIMKAAMQAMTPDKDGSTSIGLPDFLMIERLLESGNLKYAEVYLNYKSKKNKDKQLQLQRENMQLDSQREQEAIKIKEQLSQATEKIKTDEAIRLYQAKKAIDEQYAQADREHEKEMIQLKGSMGLVQTVGKIHAQTAAEQGAQQ